MTYPTQPARSGMPPWARWSLIGCGGCGALAVLGIGGCMAVIYFTVGKNMKLFDVSNKRDAPLTATVAQVLPPRVGAFVRQQAGGGGQQVGRGASVNGWHGTYRSTGGQKVEVTIIPTRAMEQARRSPFGGAMPQQNPPQNSNKGVRMSMKMGGQQVEIVTWSKPNWTFSIQSPDMAAMQFAKAYQPSAR
jgi:hypothetical protein